MKKILLLFLLIGLCFTPVWADEIQSANPEIKAPTESGKSTFIESLAVLTAPEKVYSATEFQAAQKAAFMWRGEYIGLVVRIQEERRAKQELLSRIAEALIDPDIGRVKNSLLILLVEYLYEKTESRSPVRKRTVSTK